MTSPSGPLPVAVALRDPLLADLVRAHVVERGVSVADTHHEGPRRVVRDAAHTEIRPGDVEVMVVDIIDAEALAHCSRRSVVAVLSHRSPPELLDLALTIADRAAGLVLDPVLAARLAGASDRRNEPTDTVKLTPRQVEIIEGLGAGRSTKQIAHALGVTSKTVENQATRIYAALGAANRHEAVQRAIELGLVSP